MGDASDPVLALRVAGGRRLVGNFSVELPANERVLIEWLLERQPLYRDQADYRCIFAGTRLDPAGMRFRV